MIERFYTITNPVKDPGYSFTAQVADFLYSKGKECICIRSAEDRDRMQWQLDEKRDCVIVIGGDGTVLRAAHSILGSGVPMLGINLGTLGYLAQIDKKNWEERLGQLLSGDFEVEPRMMLEGRITCRAGEPVTDTEIFYALNEAVIVRGSDLHVLNFNLYVDGLLLNNLNADGIIIATPTGSTAYSMSAGGPIVEPKAQLSVVTPICPHTLNSRSIVLSPEDVLSIELANEHRNAHLQAGAVFDGNTCGYLRNGDRIEIRRSGKETRLIKLTKRSFLSTLHKKMAT